MRTDDDSWDIATSVGATAVMVAMARATETHKDNRLIRDEFAEPLVSTPELGGVRRRVLSWLSDRATNYFAVRTHVFDAFFTEAAAAGIRQHVILAAGLDSRAYRLEWPDDAVVYEIDMPKVLQYKATTLTAHGATPKAARREVAVDLRHDWPAALSDAGFQPSRPTAWLVEGLLPYLPGAAQKAVFAAIDRLSAAGSRVAVEAISVGGDEQQPCELEERWAQLRAERGTPSEKPEFDPVNLFCGSDGWPDCARWFTTHGWSTRSVDTRDEAQRLGRPTSHGSDGEPPWTTTFVTAQKPPATTVV